MRRPFTLADLQELQRAYAARRVGAALAWMAAPAPRRSLLLGLARRVAGRWWSAWVAEDRRHIVPFGWLADREPSRYAWIVGPWWIMLPRRLWARRWAWLELLLELDRRHGWQLLDVPYEACLYREIRPAGWRSLPWSEA